MTKSKIPVLIVDDEELIRWSLCKKLEKEGYATSATSTGAQALSLIATEEPQVVLLDQRLPDLDGIQVLEELKRISPGTIVIMMTAYGNISTAVQAMKLGAYEYVNKPIEFEEITLLISRAIEANRLQGEIVELRKRYRESYGFSQILGESPAIQEILQDMHKIANSEASTVLIQGESGTGKELVARAIHYESRRLDKPFVAISCAALPETLLESELFGHEKGAFTDAKHLKKGQLELAEGGTVFLDEIGEISPAIQVKLLRVLETRCFKRLGGTTDIELDARIMAATNRDLMAAMKDGSFRQDLYYRLKVISLRVPSLRERRGDIPLLANHFITHFNKEFGKKVTGIDEAAQNALRRYDWPGNVRELRNVIEHILILETAPKIQLRHLPREITDGQTGEAGISEIGLRLPLAGFPLEEMERIMIQKALEANDGNQTRAAKWLSISRDALRYKMKKFGFLAEAK